MEGLKKAIELAGGVPALARKCGYPYPSRIWNWMRRGRIPGDQIPVIRAAVDNAVPAEDFLPIASHE